MKKYVVNIAPQPWQRARVSYNHTNKPCFFDGQAKEKLIVSISLSEQHNGQSLYNYPIHVSIIFFMESPKDHRKRPERYWHTKVPDLDNLLKFILDAARGVLWEDDKFICSIHAQKVYNDTPRVEFTVEKLIPNNGQVIPEKPKEIEMTCIGCLIPFMTPLKSKPRRCCSMRCVRKEARKKFRAVFSESNHDKKD